MGTGKRGWLVDDTSGYGLPQVENPSNPAGQGPFSARISGGTWYKQSEKSTWKVGLGTTMEFNVTAIDCDFCDCGDEWVADDPVYYLWKKSDVEVQEGTSNTYTYTFNSTGTYTIKVGGDGYSHLNPSRGCYAYDGYASLYTTPITVTVVTVNSVTISAPTEGSKHTFLSGSPGEATITCTATADPSSATELITWTCEDITGTQKIWSPDPPVGGSVTLTLRGLPSNNQYFGDTWIKASACGVEDTQTIKLFFTADATNHPADEGTTTWQNWYYYYKQTSANPNGQLTYDANCQGDAGGYTTVVYGAWKSFICPSGHHPLDRDSWGDPSYIDRFAWTSRHELKHLSQMTAMWGANGYDADQDEDGDALKDTDEATYCRGGYSSANPTTYQDQVDYKQDPIPDAEDVCMRATSYPYAVDILWTNGSANSSDWANPGKQY
jgi:hypothetical protein